MKIEHTDFDAQYPWPEDMSLLQGGTSGLVIRPASKGGNYGTAFVEAFPAGTFIRGEGPTVPEAETACWEKYQRDQGCPGHEYEARHYRNGGGICKHCGRFASKAFTPEQLGCFCKKCGVPTFWSRIDEDFYCEEHATDRDTLWLKAQRLRETAGTEQVVTGSQLSDVIARLEASIADD